MSDQNEVKIGSPPFINTCYDRVGEIATRLGVAPLDGKFSRSPTVIIITSDGRSYDAYDLISAFLDKIDSTTKRIG